MRPFNSISVFFLLSSNNSGDTVANQKDSLDSVAYSQKDIIDSAADRSREMVDQLKNQERKWWIQRSLPKRKD